MKVSEFITSSWSNIIIGNKNYCLASTLIGWLWPLNGIEYMTNVKPYITILKARKLGFSVVDELYIENELRSKKDDQRRVSERN